MIKKKSCFWMMTAVLACGLTALFTSCGDDEEKPKSLPAVVETARTYAVKLAVAEVRGMPVKVAYYDAEGKIQVEQVQGAVWEKTVSYDLTKPCKLGFTVARMMDDVDYMNDEEYYSIKVEVSGSVMVKRSDGTSESNALNDANFLALAVSRVMGEGIKLKKSRGFNYYTYASSVYENSNSVFQSASDAELRQAMGLQRGVSAEE